MNDYRCPKCDRLIIVNMARHLRLVHTTYVCSWGCPVSTCPLWFTSELNGKDHIERTHPFREGRGHSFYECLREFGLEWFGSRTFFDQCKLATQSLWMDLALAPFRPGAPQYIHDYEEPGFCTAQAIFHGGRETPTTPIRRLTGAFWPTVYAFRDSPVGNDARCRQQPRSAFRGQHGARFVIRGYSHCHHTGWHITVCFVCG